MWPRSNLHSRPEISGDPYYALLFRAHEPAILQHSAVLHKGRQRHLERSGKFAHRGRTARQPFENSPAGRIAQSVETWVSPWLGISLNRDRKTPTAPGV
jgi:hypothetical protein